MGQMYLRKQRAAARFYGMLAKLGSTDPVSSRRLLDDDKVSWPLGHKGMSIDEIRTAPGGTPWAGSLLRPYQSSSLLTVVVVARHLGKGSSMHSSKCSEVKHVLPLLNTPILHST